MGDGGVVCRRESCSQAHLGAIPLVSDALPNTTMTSQVPQKAILSPAQLEAFQTSETRQQILSFIDNLNNSVVGAKLTDPCTESQVRSLRHRCTIRGSEHTYIGCLIHPTCLESS